MKLAYFSPMPPARTGVATYSRQLSMALAPRCQVTVFTPTADALGVEGVQLVDFVKDPAVLKGLRRYDQVLYHIGNNPWFHLDIWKAMNAFPGPVCLHDVVIYYLAAGLGRGALLKELFLADAPHALENLRSIEADCPDGDLLRYATPSRHPCVHGLLEVAPHIIVHNNASADGLRALGYSGRIDVIPILHYNKFPAPSPEDSAALRRRLGYGEEDFVFGAFGFIGPTKRLDKVLKALARLRDSRLRRQPRLLIVGDGESLDEHIRALGLESLVQQTGFLTDAEFREYLGTVDALVNLRYPSHGESSASLVQAMSYGKACIVTADASFGELPEGAVYKVPHDSREVDALTEVMLALVQDTAGARNVAEAGRAHVHEVHSPGAVAGRFLSALSADCMRDRARDGDAFDPVGYLEARVQEVAAAAGQEHSPALHGP
jgi:glycosyltransferase involved in cell wall biosynthesis